METNRYRTSGVIDESTYPEINKAAFGRGSFRFIRVATVITGLLTLVSLIALETVSMSVFLVLTMLLIWWPKQAVKSSLDMAIKRLYESYPAGYMQIETWFTDEGMAIHNLSDGGQVLLSYSVLQKVAETERYFYIATKANQFNLVFKSYLTSSEQKEFLSFLQQKCPDIKVVH